MPRKRLGGLFHTDGASLCIRKETRMMEADMFSMVSCARAPCEGFGPMPESGEWSNEVMT